jgi:hypothetical protein
MTCIFLGPIDLNRCTVVENPGQGWGSWKLLCNFQLGRSLKLFYCILGKLDSAKRGVHELPSPFLPQSCVHLGRWIAILDRAMGPRSKLFFQFGTWKHFKMIFTCKSIQQILTAKLKLFLAKQPKNVNKRQGNVEYKSGRGQSSKDYVEDVRLIWVNTKKCTVDKFDGITEIRFLFPKDAKDASSFICFKVSSNIVVHHFFVWQLALHFAFRLLSFFS